jgi:phosphatidylserine/phosphatidylglycerophosphate/cardiolipin synthase-like enzyme
LLFSWGGRRYGRRLGNFESFANKNRIFFLVSTELILNAQHYTRLLLEEIVSVRRFLWIATADIKDLHIAGGPRRQPFRPVLGLLADLVRAGAAVRLIHAKEPGPRFRADFDRFPELRESDLFERALCPRMHMKLVIIDGRRAYIGSANLTGAGLGAKNPHRRNFEAGILTDDPAIVGALMAELDALWLGSHCGRCQLRSSCPDPLDAR